MVECDISEYGRGSRQNDGGLLGVALLALLLCGVFFLSVGAYGIFAEESGTYEGNLPGAVLALRDMVTENGTVSVLLGLRAAEDEEEQARRARILAAAEAYIREKES